VGDSGSVLESHVSGDSTSAHRRDEFVSALDVSVQAQILNLLRDLQDQLDLTYLFIAHDLSVIRHISDHIAVMYVGKLVESAPRTELFSNPMHPYTEALMSAVPKPDPRIKTQRILSPGEVADPANPPSGCYFISGTYKRYL
jgi:peptide/nickel transport system ATP-binding protein